MQQKILQLQHELQQCSAPQQQHSFSTCAICNDFISNDGICDICPRHLHLPQSLRQHRLQHLFDDTDNTCDVSAFNTTECTCSSIISVVSAIATTLRASSAAEVLKSGIYHGLRIYLAAATSDLHRQRQHGEHGPQQLRQLFNSATAAAFQQLQYPRSCNIYNFVFCDICPRHPHPLQPTGMTPTGSGSVSHWTGKFLTPTVSGSPPALQSPLPASPGDISQSLGWEIFDSGSPPALQSPLPASPGDSTTLLSRSIVLSAVSVDNRPVPLSDGAH